MTMKMTMTVKIIPITIIVTHFLRVIILENQAHWRNKTTRL